MNNEYLTDFFYTSVKCPVTGHSGVVGNFFNGRGSNQKKILKYLNFKVSLQLLGKGPFSDYK